MALDQFSTPLPVAAIAALAAQVRPGDRVLEPSAGTGQMAAIARALGGELTLNEIDPHRAGLLDALFPEAARSRDDGAHVDDTLEGAGRFDVVLINPPFSDLARHLTAALGCLAEGGRMAAIVPAQALGDATLQRALARRGRLVAALQLPARSFARHGVDIGTGLLVVDRGPAAPSCGDILPAADLSAAAAVAAAVPERASARDRPLIAGPILGLGLQAPRRRGGARLEFLDGAAPLEYSVCDWTGEGRDVGLFQAWRLGRISFETARPHPTPLVESGAMASVPPPAPAYRPHLPPSLRDGRLSDAQCETVVCAGEAHSAFLPGWWRPGEAPHELVPSREGEPGALLCRQGFFLGDGTGRGEGPADRGDSRRQLRPGPEAGRLAEPQ